MARRKLAPSDIKIEFMIMEGPSDSTDIIAEIFQLLLAIADEDDLTAD